MDIVYIEGLRTEAVIGIHPWERHVRQELVLDLELASDNRAASSDKIDDAVDYDAVSQRVLSFVQASRYQLIETLAERLAAMILAEFAIPWLRLRLSKPHAVPAATSVGVVIERGERP